LANLNTRSTKEESVKLIDSNINLISSVTIDESSSASVSQQSDTKSRVSIPMLNDDNYDDDDMLVKAMDDALANYQMMMLQQKK